MAGVTQLRTALSTTKQTLARQLKLAGYTTGVFGKMHFNQPGKPGLHGFDDCGTEDVMQRRWAAEVQPSALPEGVKTKPLPWRPFQTPATQWLNAACLPYPRDDAGMKGTFIARQAESCSKSTRCVLRPLGPASTTHSPSIPHYDRSALTRRFDILQPARGWAGRFPLIFKDLSPAEKRVSRPITPPCVSSTATSAESSPN